MPTLFQMTKKWLANRQTAASVGRVLAAIYNPLHGGIGAVATVDSLDYRTKHFVVREITDYKRTQTIVGRDPVVSGWTDYIMVHHPVEGDDVTLRVRCHPDAPDVAILLKLDDEMQFDEGFDHCIRTGKFEVFEGTGPAAKLIAEYNRCTAGVKDPYEIVTTTITDNEASTVIEKKIELCDYSRDAVDEANQTVKEYFFVEKDVLTGYFRMFKGVEISSQRIHVL
jgi:hypothetical protein